MASETEYHVQEFEEGPGGGWWAMLETSDLAEAQAYLAEQDSPEKVKREVETYGFQAKRRLMTVILTPFEEPDHLRIALRAALDGLRANLPAAGIDTEGPTSIKHLGWMLDQIGVKLDVWPVDKTSRWIGYVQGVLADRGLLDVDAERNRTRPIFHEAYQAMGLIIPETVDR